MTNFGLHWTSKSLVPSAHGRADAARATVPAAAAPSGRGPPGSGVPCHGTKAERELAKIRTTGCVSNFAVARNDQSLGEEYIKLAQALILCSLPHSATKETKITRRARLGDGSTLAVTFSATADGIGMPFGADRKLLFWLLEPSHTQRQPVHSVVECQGVPKRGRYREGRTSKQAAQRAFRTDYRTRHQHQT